LENRALLLRTLPVHCQANSLLSSILNGDWGAKANYFNIEKCRISEGISEIAVDRPRGHEYFYTIYG
jgi:hypothetical protein